LKLKQPASTFRLRIGFIA